MKRTKLCDRLLPAYCKGEEIMNMVTHISGGAMALLGIFLLLRKGTSLPHLLSTLVYGMALLGVYTISSVYHGLRAGIGKKVMQVIDHCAIYFLIAGTYSPILICGFLSRYPAIGWGLLVLQWALVALAVTLTAIDLKKYKVFSMVCYIAMGWSIVFFLPQTMAVMTSSGFYWLLAGGIAYTIGAVLFGLGKKIPWMHSVFHIFVILGSVFQYLAILLYVY